MINWEYLFILLIPLVVWILSSIFGGDSSARADKQPAEAAPEGRRTATGAREANKPASELDRFLEEARRRRTPSSQRASQRIPAAESSSVPLEQRAPIPPAPQQVTPPLPAPRLAPAGPPVTRHSDAPPVRPRKERREPVASAVPQGSRGAQSKPPIASPVLPEPNSPPIALPNLTAFDLPRIKEPSEQAGAPPIAPSTSEPGQTAQHAQSPLLVTLGKMLNDRHSLAAAFVLREILDKPLCKRRGAGRMGSQG